MARFRWWFADRVQRSKWLYADIRDTFGSSTNAKLVAALVLVAVLAGGGYIVADKTSQAGAGTNSSPDLVRLVTTVREPVKVRVHGHTVVRWRVRRKVVEAQAQTVMQRRTVRTPAGTKVISRPVVTYRKKVVKVGGKTSTVAVPQTITDSRTSTVLQTKTDIQTVTRPVTVVQTQTVVSTVTLPGTTETVTVPPVSTG
jgi:hypothetical protein